MNELRTYEGGCHCNRVRFRVNADLASVIICNCSICTKKGIIHLIVPPERFDRSEQLFAIHRNEWSRLSECATF